MRAYADADKIIFTCCFVLAVLTAATYAKWHYWWRSGSGQARMAMMTAFAGLTMEWTVRQWTVLRTSSIPDHVMDVIRDGSAALASAALAYMLASMASLNFQRVRDPGFAASRGRRHLEQTPWATDEDIAKLTAFWDEMHSSLRP